MSSKKSAQAPAPTPAPAPAPATTQTNGENGSQELARLTDHAAICTLINGVSSAAALGAAVAIVTDPGGAPVGLIMPETV